MFRSAGKCTRAQVASLWGVFSTADQAIAIVEQGITAPADGELVLVDARGWQGGQRSNWQGGAPPPWAAWKSFWCGGGRDHQMPSSGNHAFDEYRAETLRRLEDEQKEFASFLDRLRFAKDKAEFDQFMAERRNRPPAPPEPPPAPAQG